MKDFTRKFTVATVAVVLLSSISILLSVSTAHAEEGQNTEDSAKELISGTSIGISPVSRILHLDPGSNYDSILKVINDSKEYATFEVYAAPYFYIRTEGSDSYSLDFSSENSYTQISRWISIKDTNGDYVKRPIFTVAPGESLEVSYRISTPESLPAGGQYAVLFAHTLSDATNGLRAEASPGMVIYGRVNGGETITASEISNMMISRTVTKNISVREGNQDIQKSATFNHINASAKVKNNGNIDFNARGVLKVEGIFGAVHYETPGDKAIISIIPEAELTISDEWEDTPSFGIYKATWTVIAGDETQTEEMMIFLFSPLAIIITIILLTIMIIGITILIRRRKVHRSRLTV